MRTFDVSLSDWFGGGGSIMGWPWRETRINKRTGTRIH
jgi:hypothetical protein